MKRKQLTISVIISLSLSMVIALFVKKSNVLHNNELRLHNVEALSTNTENEDYNYFCISTGNIKCPINSLMVKTYIMNGIKEEYYKY